MSDGGPNLKDIRLAAELESLGQQLFSGDAYQSVPRLQHPLDAQPQVGQMGSEIDSLRQARQNASKARRSMMTDAVQRAERDAEMRRIDEATEVEERLMTIEAHRQLRDSLSDLTRRQRIEETSKKALKQLQQLSDFLSLDKAEPQLTSVASVSASSPPLSLAKEIQKRMLPNRLRPSDMFRSNLAAMDALMEAVNASQAPTLDQLDEEERELLIETSSNAEANKILMAQCTCAARLDNTVRNAEIAAATKARMECTNLFAKMTVAAANMIRTLEVLVSEKDQYIDEVTSSNKMLVQRYDQLLVDFREMEADTTRRLKEAEDEHMQLAKRGGRGLGAATLAAPGGGGARLQPSSSLARSPRPSNASFTPTTASLVPPPRDRRASGASATLGKHSIVIRQREFLEREARILQRYRDLFEVNPSDNPSPPGAGGFNCSAQQPQLGNAVTNRSFATTSLQTASFRNPPTSGDGGNAGTGTPEVGPAATAQLGHALFSGATQRAPAANKTFDENLEDVFRLDAHMKPADKKSSADWVQAMLRRIDRHRQQKQQSRELEQQLMALHDIPEPPETSHRGVQTLKEEDVVGSPAWERKYAAMREASERAMRPAVQRTPQTREVFHTDLMIKQEIRRSGIDINHGVPEAVSHHLESVLVSIKDMLVSVDYARVAAVGKWMAETKDEETTTEACNRLQAELEEELDSGLFNLRRALAGLKSGVTDSLRPYSGGDGSPLGAQSPVRADSPELFGGTNVDLLSRLVRRYTNWAKGNLNVQVPDLASWGAEGPDDVDDTRQHIRSLDILLDMLMELPITNDIGRKKSSKKLTAKRGGAEDDGDGDNRNSVGASVGMALLDVTELINSIRAAVPISLPLSVQEAINAPQPDTWPDWGTIVGQLLKASKWCKEVSGLVDRSRTDAATVKRQAAARVSPAAVSLAPLPLSLATPQVPTIAFVSPPSMALDEAPSPSTKAKRRASKASSDGDAVPSTKSGATKHRTSLGHSIRSSVTKVAQSVTPVVSDPDDDPTPPAVEEVLKTGWEDEEENPLTANVQLLAMSIRDLIFRLTKAISKTQYRAAKIPTATMREILLLDKQIASEADASKWSTEQLAALIARVVDWADIMGDIITLPYEQNTEIKHADEEGPSPVKSLPSVYSIRNNHHSSTRGDEGLPHVATGTISPIKVPRSTSPLQESIVLSNSASAVALGSLRGNHPLASANTVSTSQVGINVPAQLAEAHHHLSSSVASTVTGAPSPQVDESVQHTQHHALDHSVANQSVSVPDDSGADGSRSSHPPAPSYNAANIDDTHATLTDELQQTAPTAASLNAPPSGTDDITPSAPTGSSSPTRASLAHFMQLGEHTTESTISDATTTATHGDPHDATARAPAVQVCSRTDDAVVDDAVVDSAVAAPSLLVEEIRIPTADARRSTTTSRRSSVSVADVPHVAKGSAPAGAAAPHFSTSAGHSEKTMRTEQLTQPGTASVLIQSQRSPTGPSTARQQAAAAPFVSHVSAIAPAQPLPVSVSAESSTHSYPFTSLSINAAATSVSAAPGGLWTPSAISRNTGEAHTPVGATPTNDHASDDDDEEQRIEEKRRAEEEAAKEAEAIHVAMQKMYPGLVEEMKLKEGSIKDSVLKHRSVVATGETPTKQSPPSTPCALNSWMQWTLVSA